MQTGNPSRNMRQMTIKDKFQPMNPINTKKEKKIVTGVIIVGIILYLSKFLRPYFSYNNSALSILGFLPNFGLAFAIPFIYVSNRIRLNKPVKHFTFSCFVTLLLMILNEIRDKYQPGRVFDWHDIYASFAGVILTFLVFHVAIRRIYSSNNGRLTSNKLFDQRIRN